MTFLEKIQTHKGDLIRINVTCRKANSLNGEVGMICCMTPSHAADGSGVVMSLFIDGSVKFVLIYEGEVQFLEGP